MQGAINREIMTDLGVARAYETGMVPPSDYYMTTTTDPNWKSQKTVRKGRRRLSSAPKAVRRRCGWKEGRHG